MAIISFIVSGEGKDRENLELKVNGNVPKIGEEVQIVKEYPHCKITYNVNSIKTIHIIPLTREPKEVYQSETFSEVRITRAPGGYQKLD